MDVSNAVRTSYLFARPDLLPHLNPKEKGR